MTISLIITLVVILVGVFLIFETLKRKNNVIPSESLFNLKVPSAEETGPTPTGRFRVQQMLKNTEKFAAERQTGLEDDEEVSLPDPFDPGPKKPH